MNDYWNRPCAAHGLNSYRYGGPYGWIMIGATDDADALREAARDSGHELAIALGERLEELEDCADQLADAIAEARELDQRCDALREELEAMRRAWDVEHP